MTDIHEMHIPKLELEHGVYENVTFRLSQYIDGSPALYAVIDGWEPLLKASVAIEEKPAPGHVWVKTWAENEGLLPVLIKHGILEKQTGRVREVGYGVAIEAKLSGAFA